MEEGYWSRIEKQLKSFWKPGEDIICISVYKEQNSTCKLCGHEPITWNHVLINTETKARLIPSLSPEISQIF